MFAILLIASMFCQGLAIVSYGNSFITAFPENIGFFHPYAPFKSLRVTALYPDTTVTVYNSSYSSGTGLSLLQAGITIPLSFPNEPEIHQLNSSMYSVRITSDKNIVVHFVSKVDNNMVRSIQTNVVQPTENLGTDYLLPSLNYTNFLASFSISPPASEPKRYSWFRLIIINAEDKENDVTIVRKISETFKEEKFKIPSYQFVQVQADPAMVRVKSSHKIAVLMTHPCSETSNCKCNMVVNQILPTNFQGQNFVVPSIPDITQSELLMTSEDNKYSLFQKTTQLLPSSSGFLSLSDMTKSQYVTASGSVSLRLISPGLIIELIPENMFAACYLLQFYSSSKQAFVIAETDTKDKLYTHNSLVTGAQWTVITDTKYSSAILTLTEETAIIWHPTSKIGVYILDKTGNAGNWQVYGGPAMVINETPDPNGCVVIPGAFEVGKNLLSWTESLKYCTDQQKQFACPSRENVQTELASKVNTDDKEGWIGLRRSLMTTDWYWQNTQTTTSASPSPSVDYVHWAIGHPQDKLKGFCASLSLDGKDNFKWKSASCCEKKRPVCYKTPTCLNVSPLSSIVQF